MQSTRDILHTDPAGLYFNSSGRTSNEPSELVPTSVAAEPDEMAVTSTLLFGAAVPPLSPWKGVRRFMPGYRYRGTSQIGVLPILESASGRTLEFESLSTAIEAATDRFLREVVGDGPHPVVLFSGGVDSGFLASRLAACGYSNSLLLNFSFASDDPESLLAERMADHLGLPFERVQERGHLHEVLSEPGRVYPAPFGDHSVVPTAQLAHSAVSRLQAERRPIVDGTGADGAFGMNAKIRKWRQLSRLPRIVGSGASGLYAAARLWLRYGSLEYGTRILRRSATMPSMAGIVAQNPLAGILYVDTHTVAVHDMLVEWIRGWAGESFERQAVAADLALTCANVFVPKSRPLFTNAGLDVQYPFLSPEMLSLALEAAESAGTDEPKIALKRSLAEHVPPEMVYRPKSGFVDPRGAVFRDPVFLEYLSASANPSGPIAHLLIPSNVSRACRHLEQGRMVPPQTLNALWSIAFTDRWYRTAKIGS